MELLAALVLVAAGYGGGRVSWDEDSRLCGMLLVVRCGFLEGGV